MTTLYLDPTLTAREHLLLILRRSGFTAHESSDITFGGPHEMDVTDPMATGCVALLSNAFGAGTIPFTYQRVALNGAIPIQTAPLPQPAEPTVASVLEALAAQNLATLIPEGLEIFSITPAATAGESIVVLRALPDSWLYVGRVDVLIQVA